MTNNKPVHEIRIGRIVAAIWKNESPHGTRHSVTLSKIYKDATDKWQRTDSFWRDDLPIVEKVADLAFRWIHDDDAGTAGAEDAA